MGRIGLLLVNLGTPRAATKRSVYRYLSEFLTDRRVIELPAFFRYLLVQGLIIPSRVAASTRSYQSVWTEKGSPLLQAGLELEELVQKRLGEAFLVKLAMRYQDLSIESRLKLLEEERVKHIVIFPLFPQYSSSTTGSVFEEALSVLGKSSQIPDLSLINNYCDHPAFIQAFAKKVADKDLGDYDHIVFSYHGLPKKSLSKNDPHGLCQKTASCCENLSDANRFCYAAQCRATTKALAKSLKLNPAQYSQSFQSRLGKDIWLEPYTKEVLEDLAHQGAKRVLVFCPAFVADCLETLQEIAMEYQEDFRKAGGELLELVPSLNSDPAWVEAVATIVEERLGVPRVLCG